MKTSPLRSRSNRRTSMDTRLKIGPKTLPSLLQRQQQEVKFRTNGRRDTLTATTTVVDISGATDSTLNYSMSRTESYEGYDFRRNLRWRNTRCGVRLCDTP